MLQKLGLIQSRGIGDIIIALPIAKWYHDRGVEVHWPIDERFLPTFQPAVDYVRFIPFPFQPTLDGFVQQPLRRLKAVPCERIVALYSYLSNCPVNNPALFQSLKFDEYKYAVAGVPFAEKWRLSLKRDVRREQAFYERIVRSEDYIVVHRRGSDVRFETAIPQRFQGCQVIEIEEKTDSIFDWLLVLERARFLLLLDSCFANLVEQLGFGNEKTFVLRSDVRFTPVLRSNWQFSGQAGGHPTAPADDARRRSGANLSPVPA
ncbi:MAG: hypothetical protein ACREFX_03240 [Opitutaceae bacterium]